MVKYHINGKGEAGKCSAQQGGCPFGDESEHFTSADAARKHYEKEMEGNATPAATPMLAKFDKMPAPEAPRFGKIQTYEFDKAEKKVREAYREVENDKTQEPTSEETATHDSKLTAIWAGKTAEGQLAKDRVAAVLKSGYTGSIREAVESGVVNENSPRAEINDANRGAAAGVVWQSKKSQEKFYNLPASFVSAFASSHPMKAHSTQGYAKLVDVATAVHAKDPSYTPGHFEPPARRSGYDARNGMKQMQNLNPQTYDLLRVYTEQKYGEKAPEFWRKVQSDLANFPKIGDFARAEREFDKLQGN
jgi:hypothetical protein